MCVGNSVVGTFGHQLDDPDRFIVKCIDGISQFCERSAVHFASGVGIYRTSRKSEKSALSRFYLVGDRHLGHLVRLHGDRVGSDHLKP